MFTLFKQWKVRKDLMALAQRKDFVTVDPFIVTSVLERFADSKSGSSLRDGENSRSREKRALMTIWEHARGCSKRDNRNQAGWQRVMASCNALYEQYGQQRNPQGQSITL